MTVSLRRALARRLASRQSAIALALAGASLLSPHAAHAFCRTTTTPIPANYSPTRGCFTDGLPLFWKGACVGYSANSEASAIVPLEAATTVIDQAFDAWNNLSCPSGATAGIATSNLGPVTCSEVRYNTNGPNQNVIVFRDVKWPYSDPNNTLGLTTVTFNADTGEIYDADMEINATGGNLSTSNTVPANGFDLLSVITHEAGHFLGLAHATDAQATMFASYKPGSSSLRSLAADDIAGLCEIYPSSSLRAVAASVSASGTVPADACDPTPRHGFASACSENPAPSESTSDSGGCSVGPGSVSASRSATVGLGLALAAAAASLRRRRRREG
jgi:MYXO-CTERM domain-containing protein